MVRKGPMTPSDVHCVSETLKSSKQTTRSLAFFSNIAEVDHELRGSASPVLMAAGLDNGRFSTPQNPHPLTDDQKICYRWLRRQPLRLCRLCHPSMGWFWAKITKILFYFIYLFIYTFLGNSRIGQTSRRIFMIDGSTTRTRARVCLLDFSLILLPISGVEISRNPNFWGANRR